MNKKTIFIDTNILCKCYEYTEMCKHFSLLKISSTQSVVSTDIFLKEFEIYVSKSTKYKNPYKISLKKNIISLVDKKIDCKETYKKHEFDIIYRDATLRPPHKLKGNKKRYSFNNHNDTISWLAIMEYCKENSESCVYEFWSNDNDFFMYREFLEDEFYDYTNKKISFKTFHPIDIFEKEYVGMQFETLHSWILSFDELINDDIKNGKFENIIKICDLFLKKNKYTSNHPIETITNWLKEKNNVYIDINQWFINFYKKICDYEFLKKIKTKKGVQYYKKDEINNFLNKFSFLKVYKS